MRTRRLPLAFVMLAATLATAAAAQSVSADVSTRQLAVGERLTYTVTLQGVRGERVAPPDATGALRLVSSRPTLDISTSFGGTTERRVAWAYEAVRPGAGRLAPARVTANGQTVTLDAVTVTVTPRAPTPPASTSSEIFARAELSRTSAVVGQQVIVEYVLYFEPHVQPRQTAPVGTWDAAGFWREEMVVPAAYPRAVRLNGQPYEAVTIRRVALFPTRAGTLELAPLQFSVDLLRVDRDFGNDPFAPFFAPFSSRFDEAEVTAPAVTIDVADLPPGAPPGFAGAVGQFDLTTTAEPRRLGVGDPLRVQVAIAGTGNVATVEPPTLVTPPGFDAYDPAEEREIRRGAEPLRGVKTFTYTLVPQGGGTFEVPAAPWSYYDPADGRYKTLRTTPLEVTVDGPTLAETAAEADPGGPAPLLTSADWRRPPGGVAWLWVALGGGLGLPAVAAGLFFAARLGRQRLAADTPAKRRRRAGADVRRRLAAARTLDGPAACAEAERATRTFLADRLGVDARPGADLAARLDMAGVPPALRDRTLALLAACQTGQFAPGLTGAPPPAAVVDEAEATLADLDALRLDRAVPAAPA